MSKSRVTGSPMPMDESLAPNPPYGAVIDYLLPAGVSASDGVTLEILDSAGAVVRPDSLHTALAQVKDTARSGRDFR